jgi:hypothetical protein
MYSKRAISSAHGLMREHTNALLDIFKVNVGKDEPLEVQTAFLAYTTDVINSYMFNIDSGLQADPEASKVWRHSTEAVAQATPLLKQFPWLSAKLFMLPDAVLYGLVGRFVPDVASLLGVHKVLSP